MAEADRQALLALLRAQYGELLQRLARRLGSADRAAAALHDVFVRLEAGTEIGTVEKPASYLFGMAMNAASNQVRQERDLLTASEIAELVNQADEAPSVEREVQARHDVQVVLAALDRLKPLQREIFLAAWLDRKTQVQIAAEFKVHKRTVQKEIERVRAFLAEYFFDDEARATAFGAPDVSSH